MHRFVIFTIVGAFVSTAAAEVPLKDTKDKVSYSIGCDIGSTFKKQNMEINVDAMVAGMKDALTGGKLQLTEEQMKETLTAYSKELNEKQMVANKEAGTKNAAAGEKFLTENKGKQGVKTTASGLQYKVIKEGAGASPKETDTVVTHYRGTLINGKEFDSSYKRGEPASFPVNRVIKGWTEGLQLMKVGSKFEFYVPASLAYGERGAGQDIGPNETLIFEVELKEIKPGATESPGAGAASPAAAASPKASPAASPKSSP